MAYNILILGAAYGSLLASKMLFGGHKIHHVCLPAEADLINAEGFRVRLPVKGRKDPVEIDSRKLPGKVTASGAGGVKPSDYDLVGRLYDPSQWQNAFGMSQIYSLPAEDTRESTIVYRKGGGKGPYSAPRPEPESRSDGVMFTSTSTRTGFFAVTGRWKRPATTGSSPVLRSASSLGSVAAHAPSTTVGSVFSTSASHPAQSVCTTAGHSARAHTRNLSRASTSWWVSRRRWPLDTASRHVALSTLAPSARATGA